MSPIPDNLDARQSSAAVEFICCPKKVFECLPCLAISNSIYNEIPLVPTYGHSHQMPVRIPR